MIISNTVIHSKKFCLTMKWFFLYNQADYVHNSIYVDPNPDRNQNSRISNSTIQNYFKGLTFLLFSISPLVKLEPSDFEINCWLFLLSVVFLFPGLLVKIIVFHSIMHYKHECSVFRLISLVFMKKAVQDEIFTPSSVIKYLVSY